MVTEVGTLLPEIDLVQLKIKFATLLAAYDIKPAKIMIAHPDIAEKVKLFLSAKRLEGLSGLTLKGYEIELKIFGTHIQKPVDDITINDLREFLSRFEYLRLSSLSRKISVIKSFFAWLVDEELIQKDPSRKLRPPKKERLLPKALCIEELEMLREACQTTRERAMVEIFYATGCRLSEIYQLNRNDIDWLNASVKVIGKGSKEREVYLSFKAMFHLKRYLSMRKDEEPALFVTERKQYRRLSRRGFQREIKILAERAGIKKKVHPHIMRHTFATLTLNAGADLSTVQALLGHSNPGTTQVYAQISNDRKRDQYKRYLIQ